MQDEYLVRDRRDKGTIRETTEGINKPCKQKICKSIFFLIKTSALVLG